MDILEVANELLELSETIGNGAEVTIGVKTRKESSPTLVFGVDWPDFDYHFRFEFSFVRLAAQPGDILNIITYHAQKEFNNKHLTRIE